MHSEIELVRKQVLGLFTSQRSYLNAKPTQFLEELQHRAKDELHAETFSAQAAAQINYAATTLILEDRKGNVI